MVFLAQNIAKDNQLYDAVVVIHPFWGDERDFAGEERFKARISKDGKSFLVTKPRMPKYFIDHVDSVWTPVNNPFGEMILAHKVAANYIEEQGDALMKTTKYTFTDLKVKGEPFNENSTLKSELNFFHHCILKHPTDSKKDVFSFIPYVTWQMCVDQQKRVVQKAAVGTLTAEALARTFGAMNVSSTP
jgi:hypothetical protein